MNVNVCDFLKYSLKYLAHCVCIAAYPFELAAMLTR